LLLKKDVNLVAIKNLLGHKSIESTQIYLNITGEELEDSINLL
jgi:site-specific recombinase XerD